MPLVSVGLTLMCASGLELGNPVNNYLALKYINTNYRLCAHKKYLQGLKSNKVELLLVLIKSL